MLKKHNKLIMLLVLVTFMFTMVGSAGAATFSDVTGASAEASAIYKLNGLGIIDGYPDGTFGPEKTITRAEFAKIACVTAGLKSVASGMGGTASPFSDVAADHWANGWINVAAAQGFVKGDPAGTFRPEDQITQAEAVTVLLRLLGYNDNLPGEWPSDYIAKAANLGVLDDVTFVAGQAATRGVVAVLAGATLDETVVEYYAADNVFQKQYSNAAKTDEITLLEEKFDDSTTIEKALITEVNVGNEEYSIDYRTYNDNGTIKASGNINVADGVVVSGATNILTANEHFADLTLNDDGDVAVIAVKDYQIVEATKIEINSDYSKVKANGTWYTLVKKVEFDTSIAANVMMGDGNNAAPIDETKTTVAVKPGMMWYGLCAINYGTPGYGTTAWTGTVSYPVEINDKNFDSYKLVLDKDGEVALIKGSKLPAPGIVESVNTARETISFVSGATPEAWTSPNPKYEQTVYLGRASDLADEDYFVNRNGSPATLADIKPGDAVWVFGNNYAGTDKYILAVSISQIKGTLESVKNTSTGLVDSVTVSGTTYKMVDADATVALSTSVYHPIVSYDAGEEFEPIVSADQITGTQNDLLGQEVTLVLTPMKRVGAIISDIDGTNSSRIFAVVDKVVANSSYNGDIVDMLKVQLSDGTTASYAVTDDTKLNGVDFTFPGASGIVAGKFISFTLASDGTIYNIKLDDIITGAASEVNTDRDTISIDGKWYTAKDVVLYNEKQVGGVYDETDVLGWKELKNQVDSLIAPATLAINYYVDGAVVKYAKIQVNALTSDSEYALYLNRGKDADGNYMTVLKGGEQKYYLDNDTAANALSKSALLKISWNGSDAIINGGANTAVSTATVWELTKNNTSNNIIEVTDISGSTKSYMVDADTLVYDITDTDNPVELTLAEMSNRDHIVVVESTKADEVGLLKAILVIDKAISADITAPKVSSVTATTVVFNEAVTAVTANVAGNYAISGTAVDAAQTVTGAALGVDGKTVTLTFSAALNAAAGNTLTVTVTGIKDANGNTAATAGTKTF